MVNKQSYVMRIGIVFVVVIATMMMTLSPRLVEGGSIKDLSARCSSIVQLQSIANNHIRLEVETGVIPTWRDAIAGLPSPYYDLDANTVASRLPVMQDEEQVGYVVIYLSTCQIVEYAESRSNYEHSILQAKYIAQQWEMDLDEQHPIYISPFDQFFVLSPHTAGPQPSDNVRILLNMDDFSFYILDANQRQLFSLPSGRTLDGPKIDPRLFPEMSNALRFLQPSSELAAYKELSTPDYRQFRYPTPDCWVGCSPLAGGTLMGYWAGQGFPNLIHPDWQSSVRNLADRAGTVCGTTNFNNLSGAMVGFSQEKGYSGFSSTVYKPSGSQPTFDVYRNEIDNNRPVVVNFAYSGSGSVYYLNGHANTGVGYDTSGGNYMIIKKNLNSDPPDRVYVLHSGNGPYPGWLMYNTLVPPAETTPPTINITQHPPTGQWYNADQTIAWIVSDVGSGVRGYKVAWNQNPPGGSEIGGASGSLNLSSAGQGQHLLYVQAWDNAGNSSAVASAGWFGYDTVTPNNPSSVNPGCAASSGTWQNSCNDPSFTWSGAGDSTSGVAGYHLYWGSDPNGTSDYWTSSAAFDPGPVSDGAYYFRLRTRDNAGNWSAWTTLFVLCYDGSAPTTPNSVNSGCAATYGVWQNTCSDANFTWSGASDATSGVAGYEIYWGSEPNGTGGAHWSTSAAYNPGAIGSGAVYLRTRTKDNAGNWSRWVTLFLLRYDGVAPTGSLKINNQAAVTNATSVKLHANAVDNTSGLCQMRFRDAGTAWSDWRNYASSAFWQLPGPTGRDFTVEAQYKDCAGNLSGTYADAITLDIYPARPATSSYRIVKSTFGASGMNSTTDNYGLQATLGQPSMIGQMSSARFILASGYWAMHYENFSVYLPLVIRLW